MIIQLNTTYEDKYVVNFINILNSWIYFLSWRKHYIDDMFTASQILFIQRRRSVAKDWTSYYFSARFSVQYHFCDTCFLHKSFEQLFYYLLHRKLLFISLTEARSRTKMALPLPT